MTIEEILSDFRSAVGNFPQAALEAAVSQREEITPALLHILEVAAQDPSAAGTGPDGFLPTFATYLLAQFRDKRAFPLILKMVTGPGESAHEILGESITMDLDRILASVYDGNLLALKEVIEDQQVDEYVRSAALTTLLHLVRTEQMSREDLIEYWRHLVSLDALRDGSCVWDAIMGLVADIPAPELMEQTRSLFEDHRLCIESFADAEEVQEEMEYAKEDQKRPSASIITNVLNEMKWWACFDPLEVFGTESSDLDEPQLSEPKELVFDEHRWLGEALQPPTDELPTPYVREGSKTGRNDPCPCGSGKKYKKCCGE